MSKFVKIDIPNSNGQRATIIYKPSTGGTIYLGIQTLPFYYNNDSPFGIYEVQLQDSSTICTQIVTPPPTPTPTPTPTRFATPTPTPSPTCDDTVVNPFDCEECTTYLLPPQRSLTSVTYNDLTITTEYFGPTLTFENDPNFTDDLRSCSGEVIPNITARLGTTPGFFEYKMYFNKPVNDLKIITTAGGIRFDPLVEQFDFTTNIGIPNVIMCGESCGSSISGNSLFLNCLVPQDNLGNCGGGTVVIKSPSSYTAMTISGNGGGSGTYFGICLPTSEPGCSGCSGNFIYEVNEVGKCEASELYDPTPPALSIPVAPFGSINYTTGGTEFYGTNNQGYYSIVGTSFNDLWSNNFPYGIFKGPLNRSAVRSTPTNVNVSNRFYGTIIDLKCILSGMGINDKWCVGVAADTRFRWYTDEALLVDSTTGGYYWDTIYSGQNISNTWKIFEYDMNALYYQDTIEFYAFDNGVIGFEIYKNSLSQLMNATNINQINIIETSRNFTDFNVIRELNDDYVSKGFVCPNGGIYNHCLGKCDNGGILCFPEETECETCSLVSLPYLKYPTRKIGDVDVTYSYLSATPLVGGPTLTLPNCLFTRVPRSSVHFSPYFPISAAFSYTLYFSKPINNLKFAVFGGGIVNLTTLYEQYSITTNVGTPELIFCDGCFSYVTGNTYYTTHGGPDLMLDSGTGVFKVKMPYDFNELTISAPAQAVAGTIWFFCVDPSQVPPPPTPKPPPPNVFGPNTYTSFMKFNIVGAPTPTPFPITVSTVYTRYNIY